MADDPKTFLALLNGIAKRTYYGESDITDELLKSELYDAISPEEFNLLLNRATGIIKVHLILYSLGHRPLIVISKH